jgi:tetratricopeptide (TPR) repeat protein
MLKSSGLTAIHEAPSLWHKFTGAASAVRWSQSADPPVTPDKAPFYATALSSGAGTASGRARLALCLLWSDAARASYDPSRLAYYAEAFQAFPTDERVAFFIATLCHQGALTDSAIAMASYRSVLQPDWAQSIYWKQFSLPQRSVLFTLASLYAAAPHNVPLGGDPAEAIEIVESALEAAPDGHPNRRTYILFLGEAYRAAGRTDTVAESVYRWIFTHESGEMENCRYLARLYAKRTRSDGAACSVYVRMIGFATETGDTEEVSRWTVRLALAYVDSGRLDQTSIPMLTKAVALAPEDRTLEAALIFALARDYASVGIGTAAAAAFQEDETTVAKLEAAVLREAQLVPIFEAHGWTWGGVLRALALAYGRSGRSDDTARSLYARAVWAWPEDRAIWALHARTLAEARDYSDAAVPVYETAVHAPNCDDCVYVALGHAYIANRAWADEARRKDALVLWETLYRQNVQWPELVQALAQAYVGEERVNDIAMSLWEKQVAENPNEGTLRLRLAQELRARGDLHGALHYFQEAARLLPKEFTAQFETGYILKEHYSDYPNAIKHLQKAIRLPDGQMHLQAHFALGEALLARDRRDEAMVVFQKIVDEIDVHHTPTILHLARLNLKYEEEGVRQAERLYARAQALRPDDPETYRRLADLYHEQGQMDAEEQALEKYLTLSHPDPEKYRQLADLYIRKGDFARAEGALRRVISLGHGDKRLYTLLGEVILQARGTPAGV